MSVILDRKVLMGVYEQTNRPSNFLRRVFFPMVVNSLTPKFELDFKKHKRKAAPFISPIKGGLIDTKEGFTTNEYDIPTAGMTYEMSAEKEAFERAAGQNIYDQKYKSKIAGYLVEHDNAIARQEVLMTRDILTTGSVTVAEKDPDGTAGTSWNIDFNLTNTETIGAGLKWSEGTGDPIADLRRYKADIEKASGLSPRVCVMEPTAASAFMEHAKVKDMMDTRRIELGVIKPETLEPGVVYLGTLTALGIDIYEYQEYVHNGTTDVAVMPDGAVILGPGNDNWMIGPIAIFPQRTAGGLGEPEIHTKERVSHQWTNDGKSISLETMGRFMPKPSDIDAYFYADVL